MIKITRDRSGFGGVHVHPEDPDRWRIKLHNLGWERFEWSRWTVIFWWRRRWAITARLSVLGEPFLLGVHTWRDEDGEGHVVVGLAGLLGVEIVTPAKGWWAP